jgi:hypothetical protein
VNDKEIINMPIYRNSLASFSKRQEEQLLQQRVMVLGQDVVTVQRISRYCLRKGAEVLPYYELPTKDEIILFDPQVVILCTQLPEEFLDQIFYPCIIWAEQSVPDNLINLEWPLVSNYQDLEVTLRRFCQS